LLACIAPLLLAFWVLRSSWSQESSGVDELLVHELTTENPVLLPRPTLPLPVGETSRAAAALNGPTGRTAGPETESVDNPPAQLQNGPIAPYAFEIDPHSLTLTVHEPGLFEAAEQVASSLGIGEPKRDGDRVWIRCGNVDDLALLGELLADRAV
jgi:hypothetical protein